MKRQSGFTLIELVVVIVILGILAVTAAPRFLNLTEDAKKSSLMGLKGAIVSASNITYAKSAVLDFVDKDESNGKKVGEVEVAFGYPLATANGIAKSITGIADWVHFPKTATKSYVIGFKSSDITDLAKLEATGCYVTYKQAESASVEAKTTVTDSGCSK